jgi:hypothetical protein
MSTPILKQGSRGENVKKLQRKLGVDADGDLGPITWRAWRSRFVELGGWGFVGSTARARRRWDLVMGAKPTAAEAKRAAKRRQAVAVGPAGTLAFARKYVGRAEYPSNRGSWGLNAWQSELAGGGSWLNGAPWCGIFVWASLTKGAGVKGLNSRCAAVAYIYADAAAGRNGWRSRHGRTEGKPGDAVILFGTSTHVGLIEKRVPGGYITIEGNTSSGNGGSQADGGGCYRRTRPYSAVVACCRPRY